MTNVLHSSNGVSLWLQKYIWWLYNMWTFSIHYEIISHISNNHLTTPLNLKVNFLSVSSDYQEIQSLIDINHFEEMKIDIGIYYSFYA